MGRTTPLKDQSGRTIGTVDDHGDGKRSIRDASGRTLGTYDSKSDTTRDSSGRTVGKGDWLSSLLNKK